MLNPKAYEKFNFLSRLDTKISLPEILSKMSWKNGERILDYGCGAGTVALHYFVPIIEKFNSTIDCIDSSQVMLDYAKLNCKHPLITYNLGNFMDPCSYNTKFKSLQGHYDKILMNYVIHQIFDYRLAFEHCYGLLKSGGQIGITACTGNNPTFAFKSMKNTKKWRNYFKGIEKYLPGWIEEGNPEQELCDSLKTVGFNVNFSRTRKNYHYIKPNDFIEFLCSLNQCFNQIPQDLIYEFKKDLWTEIEERFSYDDETKELIYVDETTCWLATKP